MLKEKDVSIACRHCISPRVSFFHHSSNLEIVLICCSNSISFYMRRVAPSRKGLSNEALRCRLDNPRHLLVMASVAHSLSSTDVLHLTVTWSSEVMSRRFFFQQEFHSFSSGHVTESIFVSSFWNSIVGVSFQIVSIFFWRVFTCLRFVTLLWSWSSVSIYCSLDSSEIYCFNLVL